MPNEDSAVHRCRFCGGYRCYELRRPRNGASATAYRAAGSGEWTTPRHRSLRLPAVLSPEPRMRPRLGRQVDYISAEQRDYHDFRVSARMPYVRSFRRDHEPGLQRLHHRNTQKPPRLRGGASALFVRVRWGSVHLVHRVPIVPAGFPQDQSAAAVHHTVRPSRVAHADGVTELVPPDGLP